MTTSSARPDGATSPLAVNAAAATSEDTRNIIVQLTGSGYTPVRHVLVQRYERDGERRSTLARFCSNRKHRALILYLLLLTVWAPERKPLRSEVWLRAMTVDQGKLTWSSSSLSQGWSDLVAMGMVDRQRQQRVARLTPRREDGGDGYERPDVKKQADRYFALPGAFWTAAWFDRLSLPALCVLLILLKETNDGEDECHLTYEQTEKWYGISSSSAKKGYTELVDLGLVSFRDETAKAPLAPAGVTTHRYYRLSGPFSTSARAVARNEARKAARLRGKTATASVPAAGDVRTKKTKKRIKKAKNPAISPSIGDGV